MLGLNLEGVGSKVVTLGLKKVGREVFSAITIKPRQSSTEARSRDTENSSFRNNISPSGLRLVNGFIEEVVEEQILEVRVFAVGSSDVFQEDGTNDTASAPHESDGWLIKLPFVFLGSLEIQIS